MTFYGIEYLRNQRGLNQVIVLTVIIVLCVALAVFTVLYLRHRLETKYRDLGIIVLLLVAMVLGSSYTEYRQSETASAKSAQMVNFVEEVAKEHHVSAKDVLVNSKYLNQDVIVKVGSRYYTVALNTDYTAYQLKETHMLADVTVQK